MEESTRDRERASQSMGTDVEIAQLAQKGPTPLPKLQLGVLLFVQIAEPITAWSILPFVADIIKSSGITGGDDDKIGFYSGILMSAFFVAEFCCMFWWGRLSDRIGRRPVLLSGLTGLIAAMLSFGLAQSFLGLLFARVLQGATNGNVGVMKSMMGEITDETNIAKAFSIWPAVWCLGTTIGPFMSGYLAHPAERFPDVFSGQFWKSNPFFLPCLAAASFSFTAWLLAFFLLEETLPSIVKKQTRPIEAHVEDPVIQDPIESTPLLASNPPEPPPIRHLLTKPVFIAIGNYALLALVEICMFAFLPIFLDAKVASPEHPGPGGLGLPPPVIGTFFGSYGFINGASQLFLFAPLHRRLGTRNLYVSAMSTFLPLCFLLLGLERMARATGGLVTPMIFTALGIAIVFLVMHNLSFPCVFIAIRRSAPSPSSLGAVNGLAHSVASAMRAVGPALISSLFALSLQTHEWWIYYVLFAIILGGVIAGRRLPD